MDKILLIMLESYEGVFELQQFISKNCLKPKYIKLNSIKLPQFRRNAEDRDKIHRTISLKDDGHATHLRFLRNLEFLFVRSARKQVTSMAFTENATTIFVSSDVRGSQPSDTFQFCTKSGVPIRKKCPKKGDAYGSWGRWHDDFGVFVCPRRHFPRSELSDQQSSTQNEGLWTCMTGLCHVTFFQVLWELKASRQGGSLFKGRSGRPFENEPSRAGLCYIALGRQYASWQLSFILIGPL